MSAKPKAPKIKFPRLVNVIADGVENLPTAAELATIRENSLVKVCDGYERFWVLVIDEPQDGVILGTVNNFLVGAMLKRGVSQKLKYGDLIAFASHNIYEVAGSAGEYGYHL